MKKFAQIQDDIVLNICNFKDDADLPTDWVDVTNILCNIGDPVINGAPVLRPSEHHTLNNEGTDWGITPENQALKDAKDTETQRTAEIAQEQNSAGLKDITVQQAKDIITGRYDTVRVLPVSGASNAETIANIEAKIDALINACEWIDKKEAVYLLR